MLLTLLSTKFKTMFTVDKSKDVYNGQPCITLAEDGDSLYPLLSWCDQRCTTRFGTIEELAKVLKLADKYRMEAIMKHVANFMAITNPVESIAISALFDLRSWLRWLLDTPLCDLISMSRVTAKAARSISAYSLRNLLQYRIAREK